MFTDLIKENGFTLKKARSRWYPTETMKNVDDADDLVLLANTPAQAVFQLHCLEEVARGIGPYMNANKTEFISFKKKEPSPLKVVSL